MQSQAVILIFIDPKLFSVVSKPQSRQILDFDAIGHLQLSNHVLTTDTKILADSGQEMRL